MNKHEQRARSFIYVRERSVTCSFVFDSSLVFLAFVFYLNPSKFRQIKYLISVNVLYILFKKRLFVFMNISLCLFVFIVVRFHSLPKINKQTQTNTNTFISLTNKHEHKISFGKRS
ncbi:hypothetical protein Hanom_Chr14g01313681 [Helianthus anomalus]